MADLDITNPPNLKNQKKKSSHSIFYRKIPARGVVYFLSWSGFIICGILRSSINFTILAMVAVPQLHQTNVTFQYCYGATEEKSDLPLTINYGGTLNWSLRTQGLVVSSYYWGYVATQMFGGLTTQKFGTKKIFGFAQFLSGICVLCIPWTSDVSSVAVICLRVIHGMSAGVMWPSMNAVMGYWIPVTEKSRFMSSFQGLSLGFGISYYFCGFIIPRLGWRSVFYIIGFLNIIWCLLWYFLFYDRPENHPRITTKEQTYIRETSKGSYQIGKSIDIPWRSIFKSTPTWVIGVTNFGRMWTQDLLLICGPKFMKNILGFSLEKNGLVTGLPYLSNYFVTLGLCSLADKLITEEVFSILNVRKFMTALAHIVPATLLIVIGYLGCNTTLVIVFWFLAIISSMGSFSGALVNVVDIAPNFAAPVSAFVQTILMSASVFSPIVAFQILEGQEQILSAWRIVFCESAIITLLTYLIYYFWASAEIQPWDKVNVEASSPQHDLLEQ